MAGPEWLGNMEVTAVHIKYFNKLRKTLSPPHYHLPPSVTISSSSSKSLNHIMKFVVIFATMALTASAYRCRMDRYKPDTLGDCAGPKSKVGDQTENDACSDTHTNSCYGRPSDEVGDPACWAYIKYPGCVPNVVYFTRVNCASDDFAYMGIEHSYHVECHD
ncbi:hypothetical protein GGR57DRAFT_458509 [Xylariaceae sp. FL1272]|nr:hypothetical protein GGR57DRAFT_458509 [Xylariaceae sp. FL1272]